MHLPSVESISFPVLSINTGRCLSVIWTFDDSANETAMKTAQFNLVLAWAWIFLGFVSGLVLGLFFHQEHWLGGYASFKRRLYRLCHISFFGLGVLNLCFYLTVRECEITGGTLRAASTALMIGAVTMPLCCLLTAHFPRTRPLFAVPVVSLLVGGALTAITAAGPQLLVPAARTTPAKEEQSLSGSRARQSSGAPEPASIIPKRQRTAAVQNAGA